MKDPKAHRNKDIELKERFRNLAFEKSELELLVNMMAKLSRTSDLEDVIQQSLQSIMTVIGATNIILFYQQAGQYFSVDVFGARQILAVLDDPWVSSAIKGAEPTQIESTFDDTMMTYATEDYRAFTWVYPLGIGPEVIGVIKVDNTACNMERMPKTLPVFFNYLAQILKNELQNINRLQEAYGKLEKLNNELEDRVKQRTVELENSNKALLISEEKYKIVADFTHDWEYWVGNHGEIKYISPACERITGYSPMTYVKDPALLFNLVHEEDTALVNDHNIRFHDKNESPANMDFRIRTRDGQVKWINHYCLPIYTKDGTFLGRRACNRDITELKLAQTSLLESEKKYRELADSLPQVVFEIDKAGTLIYTNQNGYAFFGYAKDELDKGLNIFQMIHPEDHDRIKENMQSVLNGGNSFGLEYNAQKKDGTTFPVTIHSNRIVSNGKPIGLRGLLIDISKQRKMETDIKHLALAIENSSDTIVITDLNGTITYVNPAFEKITGYSQEEALGKNPKILQSGSHDKIFYKELWETISSGKTWYGRFINKKKDGSLYTEDTTISPVFSKSRNIISYLAVKRDISANLELEAQLRQVQKMESIGTLAGGIAHDFNNILFPIIGHTEMLIEDIPEDSPFRGSLNEIYTGSLRARDLVQQILAFARQEKSELKLMKMQPIITEAMKLIRSTIPTTISITQNLQPDCGPVSADPTQIHQIVINLTTNAYHAMEKDGGEIKVNLKEVELGEYDLINPDMTPGLYACLSIGDTGVGMNKDVMDRIFDPFFTTKEKGKGTGMGLSVVHGIVKRMKGEIQVYSEPGKGAEFQVYLPVVGNAYEKQASTADEPIPGGCERVLLVDDEEAIIAMEKRILDRLGYQVTARPGSFEALEAFRANPDKFDLVITDMSMPKMPGDKLAVELIKIRPDIPILLCTGFSENMTDEKISPMGIKGFLMKPIMIRDLAQKIREVLDKK